MIIIILMILNKTTVNGTRQEREFGRLWIITLATVGVTTPILLLVHSL